MWVKPHAVLHHVSVHPGASRACILRKSVELSGYRLELDAGRSKRKGQVIHTVRIVGEQDALDAARAPVASEDSEKQFTNLPLTAEVGFRELGRVINTGIPVGIVLEPSVHDGVGHSHEGPEEK